MEPSHQNEVLLHRLSSIYPEKTHCLGRVFNDTTNSYKLLWFRAILALMQRSKEPVLPVTDILTEMAVLAWPSVCLYRLSLGAQDKLQGVLASMIKSSKLDANAKPNEVRAFIFGSKEYREQLSFLARYVPTRFLTAWFQEDLRGMPDGQRDVAIRRLAGQNAESSRSCLYWFENDCIRFNSEWIVFLRENMAIVEAFAEHHCALYLQGRNPSVPGIVNKLYTPTARQLTSAHKFWRYIRSELAHAGQSNKFCDIYSHEQLGESFTIDHFLPWSFVAHDLLWNLTPVSKTTNSSKNDSLPDLELYLPRLASLHHAAIQIAAHKPKLLEDHVECFQIGLQNLAALSLQSLTEKYRSVITPQAQIATNQGFPSGWVCRN